MGNVPSELVVEVVTDDVREYLGDIANVVNNSP